MGRINSKIYKIICLSFLFSLSLFAKEGKVIDGISFIINDEPITLYEVYKYSKAFNIPINQAVDILIQKKVEDREVKRSNIKVDSYDVEEEMKKIAKKNGLMLDEFKELLENKGIDIEEYKEDLKDKIKKEKLFKKIASANMRKATEEDLRRYYKNNINEFSIPREIDIVEYASSDKEELLKLMSQPMYNSPNIESSEKTIDAKSVHPKVLYIISQTPEGKFTPIFKAGDKFVTLYVKKKKDMQALPYEQVKDAVFAKVMKEREKEAIREYFEKIKAEAKILVVRKP